MGIAPPPPPSRHSFLLSPHTNHNHHNHHQQKAVNSTISMSQGFHQGIFGFSSDGFDRSEPSNQQQQHHLRRDRMRLPGYNDPSADSLVPIQAAEEDHAAAAAAAAAAAMYEPAGATSMLSEMFSFANQGAPSATELLASQMPGGYRLHRPPTVGVDWYGSGNRQATEMFLMNPAQHQQQEHQQQQRSSSPPPPANQPFHTPPQPSHFMIGGGAVVEGQGLSLSLSSSLQQYEMANKAQEELRVREGMLYYNSNPTSTSGSGHHQQQLPQAMLQQQIQGQQVHVGYGGEGSGTGGPMAVVNVLRHSKYSRPAQELLEEFCSVGRGHVKGGKGAAAGRGGSGSNPNPSGSHAGPSSSAGGSKDAPPPPSVSPADKFEHQRRKAKLLSMLDEVDRRYNHYCDQMQQVVNSFDSVMGYGAATPYTSLAQKAMSRHFRCLKDAIAAQLKQTCELLGDKDGAGGTGITKGETPRLKLLEHSLRQQRAFHQMGMMEQEAWRPQRGLPERSVNILRAWLFEHFLHPYPSDADKHLLARQTGLSRNQVTNWFINARVRLWKPMVEEMYQQEAKDEEEGEIGEGSNQRSQSPIPQFQRTEINADDNDPPHAPSSSTPRKHQQQQQQQHQHQFSTSSSSANLSANQLGGISGSGSFSVLPGPESELCGLDTRIGSVDEAVVADYAAGMVTPGTQIMFGTSGDVSLTLGLRHAGNLPDNSRFSLRDFNG